MSATSIHREKRMTTADRVAKVAEIIAAEPDEAWLIWCDTDYEADALNSAIADAVEVRGSQIAEIKERKLESFSTGQAKRLITKPSVAGYGLNWQHCARVAFVGLSFSYESYYQAVRRCYRFGQTRPVHVHVVSSDTEAAIGQAIARKAGDHDAMKREMTAAMRRAARIERELLSYTPNKKAAFPAWLS